MGEFEDGARTLSVRRATALHLRRAAVVVAGGKDAGKRVEFEGRARVGARCAEMGAWTGGLARLAATGTAVRVQGGTGTGKERVAEALHLAGARAGQAQVTVDCSALPATLIESELFGYERGAFTGAA